MAHKKVIRILQVGMSPNYGGTEAFLMSQYRAIDRTKVQFDFLNVYSEKIACQDEIEAMGGRIYYLDMARHHGIKRYHQNLDTFFSENAYQFDGVHCNFQSLINIDILKYAKKYGIKVRIAHAHNSGYGTKPNYMQKLIIAANRKLLNFYTTNYFACSPLAAKWMFGRTAIIVKNAIETDRFAYSEEVRNLLRAQFGLQGCFAVIFVGRLDPQKNPIFLLEVFHELKKLRSDAKLLVVGDGILNQQMCEKIKEMKIDDDVQFLGSRKDVNKLLQAADVFLLPSKFEGLGIALIEAQAAGLPTFTSADVVPKDAQITDLLTFIPLTDTAEEWARKVSDSGNISRKNTKEQIAKAGYDNYESAKKLEEMYFRFLEEAV